MGLNVSPIKPNDIYYVPVPKRTSILYANFDYETTNVILRQSSHLVFFYFVKETTSPKRNFVILTYRERHERQI